MRIETQQFGPLEFGEEAVLTFAQGLLGFEQLTQYLIIDQEEIAPLRWFQPIGEGAISFTVIDPLLFFPDYAVKVTEEDRATLKLAKDQRPLILVLVTIPSDPSQMTANLLGPLILNPETRLGKQLVLHDSGYPVRKRLISDEARTAAPVTV